MPEYYSLGTSMYQRAAQPYLDAIARGLRTSPDTRDFLLRGTSFEVAYHGSEILWDEQRSLRDPRGTMSAPFWANYWCEPCVGCTCRIENSVSMEIDAIFFLRNEHQQILAIHVEMKRDREGLSWGQAQAYRPRAECYRDKRRQRPMIPHHDHFIAVLFCGLGTTLEDVSSHFGRVVFHTEARAIFPNYPS